MAICRADAALESVRDRWSHLDLRFGHRRQRGNIGGRIGTGEKQGALNRSGFCVVRLSPTLRSDLGQISVSGARARRVF